VRKILVVSLLLVVCLSARADIIRYRGRDGHVYFTNTPPAHYQTQQRASLPLTSRTQVHLAPYPTLHLIHELARKHNIEPRLVQAIIRVESNFNPRAVSRAGAQGLMQLMPTTVKRYHVEDPFDPRANIEGGLRYLKYLLRHFPGDIRRVLAAYNAGEHAVQRYDGIPPYPETQRYVKRVMAFYGKPHAARKIYRYRTPNGSILFTDTRR
jgi:soluble lytic murein transglycosylase-like protein